MGIVHEYSTGCRVSIRSVVYEIVITHFHGLIGRKEAGEKFDSSFLRLP